MSLYAIATLTADLCITKSTQSNSQFRDFAVLAVVGAVPVVVRASGGRAVLVGHAGPPLDHALEEAHHVDAGNRPLTYIIQ